MPFDQFTIEQLAGDLLPNRTLDQLVGSGFNRCNMTTNEGGVIPEEYLVLYTRDRTETVSQVWLGMTAGCAVCHDHKFDPLSQREFYEMAAFFNNTTQGAMDGNIKDTPPIVVVPTATDRQVWEELPAKLAAAQQQIDGRRAAARGEFDQWLARASPASVEAKLVNAGLAFYAPLGESAGNVLAVCVGGQPRPVSLTSEPNMGRRHHGRQGIQEPPRDDDGSGRRGGFRARPAIYMQRLGESSQREHNRRDGRADG